MSPQPSNRSSLIEGTLRCLERLPPERVTARAIAEESGANLASIAYHFGSKDNLVTEATIEGLDRWLDEVEKAIGDLPAQAPAARFWRAAKVIEAGRQRHVGLVKNFLGALAKAQHDARIRDALTRGFQRTRKNLASVFGLGGGRAGEDAAGLLLALLYGLLFQGLLDSSLAIDVSRMKRAQTRLRTLLTDPGPRRGT